MLKKLIKMMKINQKMLLPKLIYFLLFCVVGGFFPFLVSLMTHAGLSTFQAGFIAGMRCIFYFFAVLWTIIADYTNKRKLMYGIVLFGTLVTVVPLPFASDLLCDKNIRREVHNNVTVNFSTKLNVSEQGFENIANIGNNTIQHKKSIKKYIETEDQSCIDNQFTLFITLLFVSGCFDQGIMAFTDSLVVNYVSSSDSPHSFGLQRSFGSVGFGISSLIGGLAIDNNHIEELPKHAPAFLITLLSGLCLLPVSSLLFNRVTWEANEVSVSHYDAIKVLKRLLTFDKLLFLFSVMIMGSGFGIVNGFLYVFMTDEIHASDTLAGLSLSLSFISELVMFPFTEHFFKYLHGPINCIALGSFTYFFRFLLMSYTYNEWLVISYQVFNAFSFALYWAAAIEKVRSFSTKECLTTFIGVVALMQFGCGNLLGNVLGGYLYDELGGRNMYKYVSFIFLSLSILLVVYELQKKYRNTRVNND